MNDTKNRIILSIVFLLSTILVVSSVPIIFASETVDGLYIPTTGDIYHRTNEWGSWDRKDGIVQLWMDLANGSGSWESIGTTSLGQKNPDEEWDIVMFKFGNPNGGKVMIDAQLHGNEFYGHELLYNMIDWVLNSGDEEAERILQNNYLLVVPCVDYRFGRTNYNNPSWMTYIGISGPHPDGGYAGVNLNRNFAPSWTPNNGTQSDNWHGPAADSENESKALIYAWETYQPRFYWNLHQGESPNTGGCQRSTQAIADINEAADLLPDIQADLGIISGTWDIEEGINYNYHTTEPNTGVAVDGAAYRNISAIYTEVMYGWDKTTEKHASLSEDGATWKNGIAYLRAMCNAVEIVPPEHEFECGFESGVLSDYFTTNSTSPGCSVDVTTEEASEGNYSLKSVTDNTNEVAYVQHTFNEEYSGTFLASFDAMCGNSVGSTGKVALLLKDANGNNVVNLQFKSNGRFYVWNYATSTGYWSSTGLWTPGNWVNIELYVGLGETNGYIRLQTDTVSRIFEDSIDTSRGYNYEQVRLGEYYGEAGTMYIDNITIDETT